VGGRAVRDPNWLVWPNKLGVEVLESIVVRIPTVPAV
jgi:hypothetical protein